MISACDLTFGGGGGVREYWALVPLQIGPLVVPFWGYLIGP